MGKDELAPPFLEAMSPEAHDARAESISPVVTAAIEKKLLPDHTESGPSIDLYDLDALDSRLQELQKAFHESFIENCIAVKANPTSGVLKRVVENGVGLECASLGEVHHSLALGAKRVIFDSPCKSKADLKEALSKKNVYINLDNEQEISDIEEILKEDPSLDLSGRVGLRVNPVVGSGSISSVFTAGRDSKFGLPLIDETRQRLLDMYTNYKWLQGVHIHVGSQTCTLEQLKAGAVTIMKFVEEVEKLGGTIKVVDIGGGLPTSYTDMKEGYTFASYRELLDKSVPQLFSGKYRIMTEFGRCVLTKPGITLSRIACVKGAPWHPTLPIAVAHVGSNQFVREAYLGNVWRHRFTALGRDGKKHATSTKLRDYNICGPLCFQGDFLVKEQPLPESLTSGDVLAIHDTGGYTLAMYSKYNSRQAGPVYGYRKTADGFSFVVLKARETLDETCAFWGPHSPPEC
eukprot:Sspe_Gene.2815::Locus_938_Transcript_1_1_Confidence_1.000_Length_1554::g.2815::m.2815/K01586/lysA; diaminopimelate decarboxylase